MVCAFVGDCLYCKNCVYLCIYDLFHILLSLWHTYGSMESTYICTYVCMNILLSTPFSDTLCLCSSLNTRHKISHPHKTKGNIIVLYILNLCLYAFQSVVLYGHVTWSLTLREEHRQCLRTWCTEILVPINAEVTWGWIKVHAEWLHDSYSLTNIFFCGARAQIAPMPPHSWGF
jgi:hypothetical protein